MEGDNEEGDGRRRVISGASEGSQRHGQAEGRKQKRDEEQKKPEMHGRMQYMQVRVSRETLEEDMSRKCKRMRGHNEDRRSDE